MRLHNLLTDQLWAITPQALESLCSAFNNLAAPGDTKDDASISALSSSWGESEDFYTLSGNVALVEVTGVIHRRGGSLLCFGWAGQDQIRAAIDQAMTDPAVRAILLSFDSPGGVAAGVKELADHIRAQTAKPIYVYVDGLCASAAFWLAAATGQIYAPVTATIGSIGVLYVHCDRSGANNARGVRYTYITGGTKKAAGHSDAPLSGADQAYFQGMIDKLHAIFRGDVSATTGVDVARPELWGDGQVFLAEQALELGLISGIVSDRESLIAKIIKETSMDKAKLASDHPELLAEIRTEAAAEARAEAEAKAEKIKATSLEGQLALVKMVAGEEAAAKVSALANAGLTADQVAALGTAGLQIPAAPAAEAPADKEAAGRQEILSHLKQATPGPVAALPNVKESDGIDAAIARIAAL